MAAAPEYSKYGKMDIRDGRTLHDLDVEKILATMKIYRIYFIALAIADR